MQATRRVAKVLGPACSGTGPCQRLLQLSVGQLLASLSAALNASSACDGISAASDCPYTQPPSHERPPPRLLLFSAHDSTLMPLMSGVQDLQDPLTLLTVVFMCDQVGV